MADETENPPPFQTDAVMEVFRRTEAERVRMAAVAAHERGLVRDPRGAVEGAVRGVEETHQQFHGETTSGKKMPK
jgi:hypothetical protein